MSDWNCFANFDLRKVLFDKLFYLGLFWYANCTNFLCYHYFESFFFANYLTHMQIKINAGTPVNG